MRLSVINILFAFTWRHVTLRPKRDSLDFWRGGNCWASCSCSGWWLHPSFAQMTSIQAAKVTVAFQSFSSRQSFTLEQFILESFLFQHCSPSRGRLCIPVKGFTKCWVGVTHLSAIPADTGSFYWYVCTFIYGLQAGDQNSDPDTVTASVRLRWFYSVQISWTVGCDWGPCGAAKSVFMCKRKASLRSANHGCRMFFWFPLLSLYVFGSQFTLPKWVCLSFVGPCDSVELAACKTQPCYSSKKI